MAVDDEGRTFEPSPDPLLETAQAYVKDMKLGETPDCSRLEGLLRNKAIFGVDLIEAGLADRVCGYFAELTAGPGAVRATLHRHVNEA
jgi:fructuronate reductase